jgi:hypothetical protein
VLNIEKFRMKPEMWQELEGKRNEETRKFWAKHGLILDQDDYDIVDEEDL